MTGHSFHADTTYSTPQLRGSNSWSFAPNRGPKRPHGELDNWQTLDDLVGEDEDEADLSNKIFRSAKRSITRELFSLFKPLEQQGGAPSMPVEISGRVMGSDAQVTASALSTSPPRVGAENGINDLAEGTGEMQVRVNGSNGHTIKFDGDEVDGPTVPLLVENHRLSRSHTTGEPRGLPHW